MPNLVANYKKQVLATQLKAEVNIIENSFRKILANEETDDLNNTPLFSESGIFNKDYYISQTGFSEIPKDSEMAFAQEMRKLNRSTPIFLLNNGGCFAVQSGVSSTTSLYNPVVYVDVNCDKSPNSIGYDQFVFALDRFGQSGQSNLPTSSCRENFRKRYSIGTILAGRLVGMACFKKVVQDGWKINY